MVPENIIFLEDPIANTVEADIGSTTSNGLKAETIIESLRECPFAKS